MANCNYKVNLTDIQNKYKFKIFCTGQYDDSDLRKMTESIFYALPRTTGTGTAVTLDGTAFSYLKNRLYATETTQETTTGKNLFNKNASILLANNCTYMFNNGIYTITNTNNSNPSLALNIDLPAGTYILNSDTYLSQATQIRNSSLSPQTQANLSSGYSNVSFTIDNACNNINFNWNSTSQPLILDLNTLMISTNGGDYEKYTGGIPQPNPDYPSEVQVIKGNNSIKIENKNLFSGNFSQFDNVGGTGSTYGYFKLPDDSKTYTLTMIAKNNFTPTYNHYIGFTANGGNGNASIDWLVSGGQGQITAGTVISKSSNNTRRFISIFSKSATTLKDFTDNFDIQLEEGSTATTYVAHQEQVKQLTLGDKEICKIGNYEDKIFKAIAGNEIYDSLTTVEQSTLDYGKWYIKKAINKILINDIPNFSKASNGLFYAPNTLFNKDNILLSNILAYKTTAWEGNGTFGITSTNNLWVSTGDETLTTVSLFITWVTNKNGLIYGVLSTPTYEKFNDTIQDQLEDIYNNMLSYEGQTNISQTNDGLPFNINSIALKDLNELIPQTANTLSSPLLRSVAPVIEEPIQEPTTERTETATEEEPVEEETEPIEPIIEEPTER